MKNPQSNASAPPTSSPSWRSSVFWHSDIEDIMDRIANEAMGYHPDSRADFFRDVMAAIKEHLENDKNTKLSDRP